MLIDDLGSQSLCECALSMCRLHCVACVQGATLSYQILKHNLAMLKLITTCAMSQSHAAHS